MKRTVSVPLGLLLIASALVLGPVSAIATPLDDYVAAPDPSYSYGPEPTNVIEEDGYTATMWRMTSQTWRSPEEVDRTVWEHQLTIIVPDVVSHAKALIYVSSGSNDDLQRSPREEATFIATQSQSIVAELRQIPNQRLKFADETDPRYIEDGRTEDELIAYCWDKFKTTGDPEWLPRLPMTKAVVRAMDTVQSEHPSINGFVVAGASKRGWTTWTTALVDTRVEAIIPMVIDILNVEHSMQHHWDAYGYWADAIHDYEDMNIMEWLHSREFRDMLAVIDPYRYADNRLMMPKYIVNATGDQFFLPDSSQFYFEALKGEKYLRYVPNADHGLNVEALQNVVGFYAAILNGTPRPEFTWSKQPDGSIRVETTSVPSAVRLWQATNPTERNFRLDTIGAAYTSSVLSHQDGGVYIASVPPPAQGWTAFFVELTFPSGGVFPLKFTTDVVVTPDTLPYRDVGGWGTIETVGSESDTVSLVKVGGSRYEMGYWYGRLLADQIAPCWAGMEGAFSQEQYDFAIDAMWNSAYFDIEAWEQELRGIADGCADAGHPEITLRELQRLHIVPDFSEYNCGLFAAWGEATADGHLYQMRNLDWSMDTGAQDYPVVAIFEPDDGEKHAVIGFAGLVGAAVGGINEHGIAQSQIMGGFDDEEILDGIPYPMLLRDVIYHDTTLAEALTRIQNATRTNQYYYCISGLDPLEAPDARLLFTSNTRFDQYGGGTSIVHPEFDPFYEPLAECVYWKRHDGGAYANDLPDGLEDDRKGNQTLYAAIEPRWGTINAQKSIEIAIADGVASTVVSIIYDATAGKFWVAFAEGETIPAHEREYIEFSLHGPIEITSIEELQLIGNDPAYPLDGKYVLTQDIDASATAGWNDDAGFDPIGAWSGTDPSLVAFTGTFDGQGHVVSNLTINRPDEEDIGLFGATYAEASIQNLHLRDCSVVGKNHGGGLVGLNYNSTILGCSATGTVGGTESAFGGLVGFNQSGRLSQCYATAGVTGSAEVGGLVGRNWGGPDSMSECYATGPVAGGSTVGGLAGANLYSHVVDCYALGSVTGESKVGGLIGENMTGVLSRCYATGPVTGTGDFVGGLLGQDHEASYETIESCFWDTETSGMTVSAGGTGLPTSAMQDESTFTAAGWDFDAVWYMLEGGSYPYLRSLAQIAVPDVTGSSETNAVTALENVDLAVEVSYAHSDTVAEGLVISQSVPGGANVNAGATVHLVISLGPEPVTVPDVVGMTQEAAQSAIGGAGLVVGTLAEAYSDSVAAGIVMGQSPVGGTEVSPGSAVALVVSLGPEPVAVPDVVGMSKSAAQSAIGGAGLVVGTVTEAYSVTVAAGNVISQTPSAGTAVVPGTAVALVVSKGPEPVEVPDVVGLSRPSASSALRAAGLELGAVTEVYSETVPANEVMSQNPVAGTVVLSGSAVNLTVSLGVEPVEVPDVVGMTRSAAEAALADAGFAVGAVTEAYSSGIPAGHVMSQSPSGGSEAVPGSAVSLVISRGPDPWPGATGLSSIEELQRIGNEPDYPLDGDYYLTQDLDASATVGWNGGAGFAPIGTKSAPFTGVFDGMDRVVSGLAVLRTEGSATDRVGLFGSVGPEGEIRNLGLETVEVRGQYSVGALAGYNEGTITECYALALVAGEDFVGGLVGLNKGSVSHSYASGTLSASGAAAGGLVGWNEGGVAACYAQGTVSGAQDVGGLIGWNAAAGSIADCYATGSVSGGEESCGGLAGMNFGVCNRSFWDVDTSGLSESDGGTGLSTAEMQAESTYADAGWDFGTVWLVRDAYPVLRMLPYYALVYTAGTGGAIEGPSEQMVNRGTSGARVTAVASEGFAFEQWSDGVARNPRMDTHVSADLSVTASFVHLRGSLQVVLAPEGAVEAGARWRRVGTEAWFESGQTEADVPAGPQSIEFRDVTGWTAPVNLDVTVAAEETTTVTGTYLVPTGSLVVTITPQAAVDAGAQWRVDGETWQASGATVTGLSVGAHTVSFKAIPGWDEPEAVSVSVEANQTGEMTGTYTVEEQPLLSCPLLETKALEPFAEASVYEPVLPSVVEENGVRLCASLAPLAVRLRSGEAIDPDSVWGVVSWREAASEEVLWLPLDEGDGWAVFEPEEAWADGESVTFTAGAYTVSGQEVGPFTYEFVVNSDVYEGSAAVVESGSTTVDPEFVGITYEIAPNTVYFEPLTVQLPVPEGVGAGFLEPAYLFTGEDGERRWVDGTHVEGWLEPGSVRAIETEDGVYLEFQVNHGGAVQLRRRVVSVSSAGMNNETVSSDLLLFLALCGVLVVRKRRWVGRCGTGAFAAGHAYKERGRIRPR